MNKTLVLKIAVSALALGTTMVGCRSAADASHLQSASGVTVKDERQAADFYAKAQQSVRAGHVDAALPLLEQAVQLSPRDAGYRINLADLYLKKGRFQSAEAAYRDVLTLDPDNRHAAMSVVLCAIARGDRAAAVATLDGLAATGPVADVGLAYALAGQPQRAVAMLEPAARAVGADARLRQNLALAYALAGDWQKARITAAQDISPADLNARLAQWAALAQPSSPADQVAALLGVRPVADPGLPERLALASPAAPTALAAAEPAPAPVPAPATAAPAALAEAQPPVEAAPAPAPVQIASAASEVPAWMSSVRQTSDPQAQLANPSRRQPGSGLLRNASLDRRAPQGFHAVGHGTGGYAVQLGAFRSPSALERAWAGILHRFGFAEATPLSTTFDMPGHGTFHRLSMAGFGSREEAGRTCSAIRAKGGACFVRAVAGDSAPQWASRYVKGGNRSLALR